MNRLPFLLLLLLCLSAPVTRAQDMTRVRHTIDTLTSKSMHGRGYTFNGDRKAAEYIQNRFEEMGLQPVNGS